MTNQTLMTAALIVTVASQSASVVGFRMMLKRHAGEMTGLRSQLRLYARILALQSGPLDAADLFVWDGPGDQRRVVLQLDQDFAMQYGLHADEIEHFIKMLRGEALHPSLLSSEDSHRGQ